MVAIPFPISLNVLTQDASDILLGALLQPTWGVYLNGMPVLQPAAFGGGGGGFAGTLATVVQVAGAIGNLTSFLTGGASTSLVLPAVASTIEFEYAQELPIATYPQEQGAFATYNKVTLPYDIRLRVCAGGSIASRQSFLYTCQAIKDSFQLFSIVTPENVFSNCNCTHIAWRRTAQRNNQLIEVDLGFQQVALKGGGGILSALLAGDMGAVGLGLVQATGIPNSIGSLFGGGSSTAAPPADLGSLT